MMVRILEEGDDTPCQVWNARHGQITLLYSTKVNKWNKDLKLKNRLKLLLVRFDGKFFSQTFKIFQCQI